MAQNTLWQPSDIVNADSGESDPPKRRGRIPQSAWPDILERHRAGATLTAIAREFDCTPSAISYIVRKAETAGLAGQAKDQDAAPAEGGAPTEEGKPDVASAEKDMTTESQATPGADAPAEEATPNRPAEGRERRRSPSSGQGSSERTRSTLRSTAGQGAGGQGRQSTRAEPREPAEPQAAAPETPEAPPSAVPAPEAPAAAADRPAETQRSPQARSEPIDAVEARLRDTARTCLVAYRGWRTQPGEASIQTLSDAMHELRKALARIEIDMSATRRDEQAQRPIPIPAHRASRRPR
jgi:transposase-like protein